jgi:hypothetical protein
MSYATTLFNLALGGSRLASGAPNSSGRLWIFALGTTIQATAYADTGATQALTQPIALNAAGQCVAFVTVPVTVLVEYVVSTGVYGTLSTTDFVPADAANTTVRNAGFSGVNADGSTVAGGDTTLDAVLTSLAASVGGVDGNYLESSGATARGLKAKLSEIWISVKDFGAKGDGIAIDTTAIQAAINRVAALGGGVVYLPPGTYIVDAALTVGHNGVSIQGAGLGVTLIKCTSTSANLLTYASGVGSFSLRDFATTPSTGSTGALVSATSGSSIFVSNVFMNGTHRTGVSLTGCSSVVIDGCALNTIDADAAARSVFLSNTTITTVSNTYLYGGTTGYSLELAGTSGRFTMTGCANDTAGFLLNSPSGTGFKFVGNNLTATTQFTVSGGAALPKGFYQQGNGVDGYTVDVATGAATVLTLLKGRDIRIKGITGAGTVTVSNPTVLPATTDTDVHFFTRHVNGAGGNCTWAFDTVFVLDAAAALPITDGHTILVEWLWDGTTSKLRELSRSNTLT